MKFAMCLVPKAGLSSWNKYISVRIKYIMHIILVLVPYGAPYSVKMKEYLNKF